MASGIERCMYCEDSSGEDIEHFWPKSRFPSRAFDWTNYLLACGHCNSNEKRDLFPMDANGSPMLVNPVEEDPGDHLNYSPRTAYYAAGSPKGQPSIDTFGLNRGLLVKGRLNAWTALQALVIRYDQYCVAQSTEKAEDVRRTICEHPFSAVFHHLVDHIDAGDEEIAIECREAVARHPEIREWRGMNVQVGQPGGEPT